MAEATITNLPWLYQGVGCQRYKLQPRFHCLDHLFHILWTKAQKESFTLQKRILYIAKKNSKEKQANYSKRGKTRVSKARLVLVLKLIGWERGASFSFDQLENEVKQNLSSPGLFSISIKLLFNLCGSDVVQISREFQCDSGVVRRIFNFIRNSQHNSEISDNPNSNFFKLQVTMKETNQCKHCD